MKTQPRSVAQSSRSDLSPHSPPPHHSRPSTPSLLLAQQSTRKPAIDHQASLTSALKLRVHILNCHVSSGIFQCDQELGRDTPPVAGREEPIAPPSLHLPAAGSITLALLINVRSFFFFFVRKKINKTPANPTLGSV